MTEPARNTPTTGAPAVSRLAAQPGQRRRVKGSVGNRCVPRCTNPSTISPKVATNRYQYWPRPRAATFSSEPRSRALSSTCCRSPSWCCPQLLAQTGPAQLFQRLPCQRRGDGRYRPGDRADGQVVTEQRERHQQSQQQRYHRRSPAVRRVERASTASARDRPADRSSRLRGGDQAREGDDDEQDEDRQERLAPGELRGHTERGGESTNET